MQRAKKVKTQSRHQKVEMASSMNSENTCDAWQTTWSKLEKLRNKLKIYKAVNVNSSELRAAARECAQEYFRILRPHLASLQLNVVDIDNLFKTLLGLATSVNRKLSYIQILRDLLGPARRDIEAQRELYLSQTSSQALPAITHDRRILETLKKIPSLTAGQSYQQVLLDLASDRVSFRGTALDLREVLREVLDYLAPDKAVIESSGFKFGEGLKSPTMKQKVHFILSSRKMSKTAIKAPEGTLSIIDTQIADLTRATYDRGSMAHKGVIKDEVQRLKMYIDTLLCELLEIPI